MKKAMASSTPTTARTASVAPLCTALCQNAMIVTISSRRSARITSRPAMYQAERSRIG
jgi:hypothetical protein